MLDLTNRGYPEGERVATLVSVSQQAWDDQWDDDTESPWVTAPKQMKSPGAGGGLSPIYSLGQNLTELYINVTQINRLQSNMR